MASVVLESAIERAGTSRLAREIPSWGEAQSQELCNNPYFCAQQNRLCRAILLKISRLENRSGTGTRAIGFKAITVEVANDYLLLTLEYADRRQRCTACYSLSFRLHPQKRRKPGGGLVLRQESVRAVPSSFRKRSKSGKGTGAATFPHVEKPSKDRSLKYQEANLFLLFGPVAKRKSSLYLEQGKGSSIALASIEQAQP
ncbi:hypothetical protein AgCh_037665 [Apium graveolens]